MNKSSMNNPSSGAQDGKIVDQAKQAVTHVASNVANQAREQVSSEFDTRKDKAVETIGNVASAIRDTSDKLKGVGPLGDVAGRAADGIEKVADFFEDKNIGDVVRDVERFARREPALFLGAAFAIGLIGGRFLKSSAHRSSGSAGQYARSGGGGFDRYEASYGGEYGSTYDDDNFLSADDLEDAADSRRYGSYGSQRSMGRNTLPLGSRAGGSSQGSAGATGSSQGTGSSFGASQGSAPGSSFGSSVSTGSSQPGASQGGSTASSSTTTSPGGSTGVSGSSGSTGGSTGSSSSGSSTAKNGLGGGSTGSV